MGKPVLKVERKSAEEIREILNSIPEFLQATRLNMVYHVAKGHSSREVAKWYGVSFKQVVNWVHRFEEYGTEGLSNRPGRGRRAYLTDDDLKKIKNVIMEKTPEEIGFKHKRWSGPALLQYINKEFGVRYKKTQTYKLIEIMGLEFKKGQGVVLRD